MKRKILLGFVVLAIAAMAIWNVNLGLQTKGMSDIMLANVEALAQSEGDPIELPEVVIFCNSYYEDCALGSPYNNGHCWKAEYKPIFGWNCGWTGCTNDTCCSFG